MAKIFITGSADGLGQLAARALIAGGHNVVLHARSETRAAQALAGAPGAEGALSGDLSSMEETKALATKANALGPFDAVIHNAAIYEVPRESRTVEGLPLLFAVNSLAPYILTALMDRPKRLIYMSSGMHLQGSGDMEALAPVAGGKHIHVSYSDSKLHDLILSHAVARIWPGVHANAVNPGWVPTKMGGAGAPDPLRKGWETQVWLAEANDPEAQVSGRYFHHRRPAHHHPAAGQTEIQEAFLSLCQKVSGVPLHRGNAVI